MNAQSPPNSLRRHYSLATANTMGSPLSSFRSPSLETPSFEAKVEVQRLSVNPRAPRLAGGSSGLPRAQAANPEASTIDRATSPCPFRLKLRSQPAESSSKSGSRNQPRTASSHRRAVDGTWAKALFCANAAEGDRSSTPCRSLSPMARPSGSVRQNSYGVASQDYEISPTLSRSVSPMPANSASMRQNKYGVATQDSSIITSLGAMLAQSNNYATATGTRATRPSHAQSNGHAPALATSTKPAAMQPFCSSPPAVHRQPNSYAPPPAPSAVSVVSEATQSPCSSVGVIRKQSNSYVPSLQPPAATRPTCSSMRSPQQLFRSVAPILGRGNATPMRQPSAAEDLAFATPTSCSTGTTQQQQQLGSFR